MRPTSRVAVSSSSQAACSASARVASPSRRSWARARVSSSLAAASAAGHDRAKVAEVEHIEVALGGLGSVAPLGRAHLRHQLLGQLQQGPSGDGGLPGGRSLGVLLLDRLTDRWQAPEHHLLGDRALLLRERLQEQRCDGPCPGRRRLALGRSTAGIGGGSGRERRAGRSRVLPPAPCSFRSRGSPRPDRSWPLSPSRSGPVPAAPLTLGAAVVATPRRQGGGHQRLVDRRGRAAPAALAPVVHPWGGAQR